MITRVLPTGVLLILIAIATPALAQPQMPDPKQMSGVPLPTSDIPAGSISVRVIRGDFSQNIPDQRVEFLVGDRPVTRTTGADGRTMLSGVRPGETVQITAVVDGERLVSQPITMGTTGVQVALVATDPEAAARDAEDERLAAGPAIEGFVVLGPQSRIVAEMRDDALIIWYVFQILNSARSPVDIGGPLIFDLPRSARGASVVEGPANQVTVNGPRAIVTGPFNPGETKIQVAFELPTDGPSAHLVQTWPATLQQLTVLVVQSGGFDIVSPQITEKRDTVDQGQPLILGTGPAMNAGDTLELEITGLPYHARWPRYVALALAALVVGWGVWGAATARPRRVAA